MIRVREYHVYKDNDYFDYDLNLIVRTFDLELIKTEQLGEFEDENNGETYYKVLAYFDIPENLELMEKLICDCDCVLDDTGRYYEGCLKLGYWGKKAMKEIYGNRIVFSNDDDDDSETWVKVYVK